MVISLLLQQQTTSGAFSVKSSFLSVSSGDGWKPSLLRQEKIKLVTMRCYNLGVQTTTDLKVHFVWVPKYRKRILTGQMAIRLREVLRQIAVKHELDIITGKVASDHVHMFISYKPIHNISKVM